MDKEGYQELAQSPDLEQWKTQFNTDCRDKIADLYFELEQSDEAYHEAQEIGDFEKAVALSNNERATAEQVVMREWVL